MPSWGADPTAASQGWHRGAEPTASPPGLSPGMEAAGGPVSLSIAFGNCLFLSPGKLFLRREPIFVAWG